MEIEDIGPKIVGKKNRNSMKNPPITNPSFMFFTFSLSLLKLETSQSRKLVKGVDVL